MPSNVVQMFIRIVFFFLKMANGVVTSTEQVDSWEIDENILTMTEATTVSSNEIVEPVDEQTVPGWINQQQGGQKLHSESVFLRLSNRVKVIESLCLFKNVGNL